VQKCTSRQTLAPKRSFYFAFCITVYGDSAASYCNARTPKLKPRTIRTRENPHRGRERPPFVPVFRGQNALRGSRSLPATVFHPRVFSWAGRFAIRSQRQRLTRTVLMMSATFEGLPAFFLHARLVPLTHRDRTVRTVRMLTFALFYASTQNSTGPTDNYIQLWHGDGQTPTRESGRRLAHRLLRSLRCLSTPIWQEASQAGRPSQMDWS